MAPTTGLGGSGTFWEGSGSSAVAAEGEVPAPLSAEAFVVERRKRGDLGGLRERWWGLRVKWDLGGEEGKRDGGWV